MFSSLSRRRVLVLVVLTCVLLITLDKRGNQVIDRIRGVFARVVQPFDTATRAVALPIARERTTWALQKQAWLDHLQERFVAAGLEGSQDALMAQDLVNHLRSRLPPSSR